MGETIHLTTSDNHRLAAYRAVPAGTAKAGLVVLQEIFGVNHHIRDVCDRFAAKGYLAVAPALFDRVERDVELGYQPSDIEVARTIRPKIPLDSTIADIAAAVPIAAAAGKVGVVGYCWGGFLAWVAAGEIDGVAAAVGYYGGGIAGRLDHPPRVPTMLHFGEEDHGIPLTDVDKIRAAYPQVPIHLYPAGHGFACDARASYDAASTAQALDRTLAFFESHLGQ
ncbi:MAG TPA: dienelactone hydrolase family protein [Aliidongia sp.]|nr:dienelactone hydrolase family protein [Aliidongia sp.]